MENSNFIKDINLKDNVLEAILEQDNITYNKKVEANSDWFIKHALLNHIGIGLIPSKLVAKELESGQLVRLLPNQDFGERGLWVVYLKEYRSSKKIKSLISILRSYL